MFEHVRNQSSGNKELMIMHKNGSVSTVTIIYGTLCLINNIRDYNVISELFMQFIVL